MTPVPRLFLPQTLLEEWALADRADVKEGKLMVASENAAYAVTAAVHFTKLVSGTDDNKLVSKVKTQEQLAALGAEQMMDSVILGECAYQVIPGYVADVAAPAGKTNDKKMNAETDLLAEFLLNKM